MVAIVIPIAASVAVLIVFIVVLYLFQNSATINPSSEGLVGFVVLLISYLIFSGRLSEVGGAGFVLRLREISRSNVAIERVSALTVGELVTHSLIVGKGSLADLKQDIIPRLSYIRITSLSIKQTDPVDRIVLNEYLSYLTTSPYFRDVIFIDEKNRFKGWIDPETLLKLLNFYESAGPLVKAIQEDRIVDIPGVIIQFVREDTTNRDALRTMIRENVRLMPVVDMDGKFIGVVERDNIVDSPLIRAIIESV